MPRRRRQPNCSATTCSPGTATLGRAYFSGLSAVAHSQLNPLMRKMISDRAGSAQINPTAKNTALELLAGPLAASTLAEYMERRATKVLLTL
jgi:hypothetical protein